MNTAIMKLIRIQGGKSIEKHQNQDPHHNMRNHTRCHARYRRLCDQQDRQGNNEQRELHRKGLYR